MSKKLATWIQRLIDSCFLGGQVVVHIIKGKIHKRNTIEQMAIVGPDSLIISLVTAGFVGMVFTTQVAREFITLGATTAVGGVLGIALSRELAPVMTAVVIAGRVGSAFAAEIGTMRVTEQIDALQMLKSDPIDYLVTPRVIACAIMLPILSIFSLIIGLTGGMIVAEQLYGIAPIIFLDSIRNFMDIWDLLSSMVKSLCFGVLIAVIGCSWGLTTRGGAKGVGQSTTTAVVTSLLGIFIFNFFLSWVMFQGVGSNTVN